MSEKISLDSSALIYKNKESIYQFTVNQLSSNFAILSL